MLLSTILFSACRSLQGSRLTDTGLSSKKILAAPTYMYKKCKGTVFINSAVKKQMHVFQKSDTGNHSGCTIELFSVHATEITSLPDVGVTEQPSSYHFHCWLTAQ